MGKSRSGVVQLDLAETNALRERLGLKPLSNEKSYPLEVATTNKGPHRGNPKRPVPVDDFAPSTESHPWRMRHAMPNLQPGQSMTFTLADSRIPLNTISANDLDETEEGQLEDTRTLEQEKYRRNVRERKRVKEYLASAGPTGVSARSVSSILGEDDPVDDAGEDFDRQGPRMEGDESTVRFAGSAAEDSVTAPRNQALILEDLATAIEDEELAAYQPSHGTATASGEPRSFKRKKISSQPSKRAQIDWGDVFCHSESTEAPGLSEQVEGFHPPAIPWKTLSDNNLVVQDEDQVEVDLLNSILSKNKGCEMTAEPPGAVVKAEQETLATLELLEQVKKVKEEVDALNSNELGNQEISPRIGAIIDEGIATSHLGNGINLTSTSEFALSLMTPLEKIEERRQNLAESRKRGAVFDSKRQIGKDSTFLLADSERHIDIEEIFDQGGMDGGLVSTLKYLKDKGDIDEHRWNLGRVGRDKKIPLHKGVNSDDVKIDYVDKWENVQNPKEAFRDMSYHFHGKEPGKKKQEKKLKRMELEHRLKSKDPGDVLPTMRALRYQHERGEAFLVLSSTDNKRN